MSKSKILHHSLTHNLNFILKKAFSSFPENFLLSTFKNIFGLID